MAKCVACGKEMRTGESCSEEIIHLADGDYPRIALGAEGDEWWLGTPVPSECHDCAVQQGGIHHAGCDMEMCPRCSGQFLGCGCEAAR
jgi:hypothetical protein